MGKRRVGICAALGMLLLLSTMATYAQEAEPILQLTPAVDLICTGSTGGPFTPSNIDYTVANAGGSTLNWTATADQPWVTVAPPLGSETNTTSTPVNVSINSAATSLAPGLHLATVTFSDGTATVTRQVSLTVMVPVLNVEDQEGFTPFGPQGGPFFPLSKTYSVSNAGSGSLIWDATLLDTPPDWLTLTKDANSVTLELNANAGSLAGSSAGTTYSATLQFTGNGGSTERAVNLTVYSRPAIASIAPRSIAPPAGGMTVYLRGSNFLTSGGTTRVFFTSSSGTINVATDAEGALVTVFSDTELAVQTPAHAAGTFDVYVLTSIDTANGSIEQISNLVPFIFAEPTLNVDGVIPSVGPIEGGTTVAITGGTFPDPGSLAAEAPKSITTGNVLRVSDAVHNVFGASGSVSLDLSLFRGAEQDPASGPASIAGKLLYDPSVLSFTSGTRNVLLRSWCGKNFEFAVLTPGVLAFVISGGATEITTFDNQIPNALEDPHDPASQRNPFPMAQVTFDVLSPQAQRTAIQVTDLQMVDADAAPIPNMASENGSVEITATSAHIQVEDQIVNETASALDVDVSLFRPAGANLLTGPASITLGIDYDETVLDFVDVDASAVLGAWYGKGVTVLNNDTGTGVVKISVADLAKALAEITTVDPSSTNQINPFPLGTLHFATKQGADLNGVQSLEVTELTMLDKTEAPFPGASGLGEVGTITVTQIPQVFFGANESQSILSSTSTQMMATTPAGNRLGSVDVIVVDPNQPEPGNYGFIAGAYTYEQPELGVSPAEDFASTGTEGSAIFNPASTNYQVYNLQDGTLNWTASVDQTWVTLSATSGSVTGSESDEVVVIINASAADLGAGTHAATITFSGNGHTTTRQVSLTISGAPALRVEPVTALEFSGALGGPFDPSSRTFNVSNEGQGTLNWTASADANWIDLDPLSGIDSGTVTVTLNALSNVLPLGVHTANITFNSDGGSVVRTATLTMLPLGIPEIVITPESGLDCSGPQGGPFLPASRTYTVSNAGDGLLNYTAVADAAWVRVLNATGSILAGEFAIVTALIDPTAAALAAQDQPYVSTLTFDDGPGGSPPITRTISLSVFDLTLTSPSGGDEFRRGDVVPIQWTYTGTTGNNQVRIELVNAGNAEVISTLAIAQANVQGANTFNWTVADTAPLGRNFKVRITSIMDNRATDTSDATFTIIEPGFEVLNPAPGQDVLRGKTVALRWNYYEIGLPTKANGLVDIYLYQGQTEILRIANDVDNPPFDLTGQRNSQNWTVPANQALGTGYRIVFKASNGGTVLGGMPVGGPGFRIVLDPAVTMFGDVNGDGLVNAADVQLVINAALGRNVGAVNADLDGDTAVDATDVQLVINAVLGRT